MGVQVKPRLIKFFFKKKTGLITPCIRIAWHTRKQKGREHVHRATFPPLLDRYSRVQKKKNPARIHSNPDNVQTTDFVSMLPVASPAPREAATDRIASGFATPRSRQPPRGQSKASRAAAHDTSRLPSPVVPDPCAAPARQQHRPRPGPVSLRSSSPSPRPQQQRIPLERSGPWRGRRRERHGALGLAPQLAPEVRAAGLTLFLPPSLSYPLPTPLPLQSIHLAPPLLFRSTASRCLGRSRTVSSLGIGLDCDSFAARLRCLIAESSGPRAPRS